jgi:hypothetical protein
MEFHVWKGGEVPSEYHDEGGGAESSSSTDGALVEDLGRGGSLGGSPGGSSARWRASTRRTLWRSPTSAAVHEAQRSDGWIERTMACAKVSVCVDGIWRGCALVVSVPQK